MSSNTNQEYFSLSQRLLVLLIYSLGLYVIGACVTKLWIPTGGGEWLWWISAIGLYLFSTLSAPFFVRPRDSLANAISSALILFTLDLTRVSLLSQELNIFRWIALFFCIITGALAIFAIVFHDTPTSDTTWRKKWSRITYDLTVPFGNGSVMFTPPAIISIVGFHSQNLISLLWLTMLWVIIVTIKPVELLLRIWNILRTQAKIATAPEYVGQVVRVDDPNIIRVALTVSSTWKLNQLHKARLPGDRHVDVLPLFVQTQNDQLIGTGLCSDGNTSPSIEATQVWTANNGEQTNAMIQRLTGSERPVDLVGFIVEESNIATIRFEVVGDYAIVEGTVVCARDRDQLIFYQVLDASTHEELFTQNPRGKHIVIAAQLGTLDSQDGFRKYAWIPLMNSPVFIPKSTLCDSANSEDASDEFTLGSVAQTGLSVKVKLSDLVMYHTAVLGVTGTGKTELVLDLIKANIKAGRKVFCVDFTGEYKPRLKDCFPSTLGFSSEESSTLEELVSAIEYGKFKAEEEKRELDGWMRKMRPKVEEQVSKFLESEGGAVGIFDLPEIVNTRSTLRATELYLSAIFEWARKNRKLREILLVLEEAHTIIPETAMFGFDKGETQAVVARMAQIALQGRKYGVGLLLVSQRTALVSKTLLSQCNTCICFTMYDKTGLDYLASVFASEHVRAIPNLRFLQAIAFGKAVKSDRPIIFEIPDDPEKRKASEALNKKEVPQTIEPKIEKTDNISDDDDMPF